MKEKYKILIQKIYHQSIRNERNTKNKSILLNDLKIIEQICIDALSEQTPEG